MRIVTARKNKIIPLGFQGEHDVTTVQFDVSGWADLYGEGTFSLMNQRPTETMGYPCTISEENEIVSWVVDNNDVFIEGNGRVQLTYTVGQNIAKSIVFITRVMKSIGVGEIPDPAPDWMEEMKQEIAEATEIAQECLDSVQVATNPEIDAALYG